LRTLDEKEELKIRKGWYLEYLQQFKYWRKIIRSEVRDHGSKTAIPSVKTFLQLGCALETWSRNSRITAT
jgi:hypothetical protein